MKFKVHLSSSTTGSARRALVMIVSKEVSNLAMRVRHGRGGDVIKMVIGDGYVMVVVT